jgi:hypothetical protein
MNLVLDDGSGTIRSIFFRNQMTNLVKKKNEEIIAIKDNPSEFQIIKEELLGKIIKVVGRVNKNEMFDRLEFMSQLVFPDPDANDELKRIEKEAEEIQ